MKRKCFVCLLFWSMLFSCNTSYNKPYKKDSDTNTKLKSINEPVTLLATFVPDATTQPATYVNRLATIVLDKQAAYTIHSMACDHAALLSMFFNPTTQFYLLNTTYTWLWGDGTSSYKSEVTHAYPMAGKYNVVLQIEMSFRGGYKYRINGEIEIEVPTPLDDEIITISGLDGADFSGTPESPPETKIVTIINTGGRPVIAAPVITQTSGENDIDWISISPLKAIIINNGLPVEFSLFLNWPESTVGHTDMQINFVLSYFTSGWHVPFISGTLVEP